MRPAANCYSSAYPWLIVFLRAFRALLCARVSLSAWRLLAGREPVALAVHLQVMNVMDGVVDEHAGELFLSKHARPFIEWQIAGRQRLAALIALAEDIEAKL